MFDKAKALENAYKKLQRQQETLKATLAEIDYLESKHPDKPALIGTLKTKRDRQAIAVKATEQLITVYSEPESKKGR